jgi:hypothetical protein
MVPAAGTRLFHTKLRKSRVFCVIMMKSVSLFMNLMETIDKRILPVEDKIL